MRHINTSVGFRPAAVRDDGDSDGCLSATGCAVGSVSRVPSEPNRWLVLTLVCVAQFMVVLDATIVNVALPSIQRSLQLHADRACSGSSTPTRSSSGASCCSAAAPPTCSAGSGCSSPESVVFTVASADQRHRRVVERADRRSSAPGARRGVRLAGSARNRDDDVRRRRRAGRRRSASGARSRPAAERSASSSAACSRRTLSWRWVFFVNLPDRRRRHAARAALRAELACERRARRPTTPPARSLVTGGLLVLVYAIVKAQSYGWGSARTLGVLRARVRPARSVRRRRARSRRAADPARHLPHAVAHRRERDDARRMARAVRDVLLRVALPCRRSSASSPLKAGLAFVPFTLGIIIGAGASQALIRKIGMRIVTFTGITIGTAGLLYFARLPTHGSYVPDILPTIAVVSIGMGLTFVPLHAARDDERRATRTRASHLGSSTPRSRSAVPSGSRSSRRSPRLGRAICSSARRPSAQAERGADQRLPRRLRGRRRDAAPRWRDPRCPMRQAGRCGDRQRPPWPGAEPAAL